MIDELLGSGFENFFNNSYEFDSSGDGASTIPLDATDLLVTLGMNFSSSLSRRKRAVLDKRSPACNYNKNAYSWSIYILFNFIVMFILPLLVSCYVLIVWCLMKKFYSMHFSDNFVCKMIRFTFQ